MPIMQLSAALLIPGAKGYRRMSFEEVEIFGQIIVVCSLAAIAANINSRITSFYAKLSNVLAEGIRRNGNNHENKSTSRCKSACATLI